MPGTKAFYLDAATVINELVAVCPFCCIPKHRDEINVDFAAVILIYNLRSISDCRHDVPMDVWTAILRLE